MTSHPYRAIIIDHQSSIDRPRGVALIIVLAIIMAVTVLSLGYLANSDTQLACGQNVLARTQIEYLADSALEHAKGLILNPQDITGEYWTGASAQQLPAGASDYYDVQVTRDDSDLTDRCDYVIDCNAYQLKSGQRATQISLRSQLRLDPCIALWLGQSTTLWVAVNVYGDAYCNGTLQNSGTLGGDVFATQLVGSGPAGQTKTPADLTLAWPRVTYSDFTSRYSTDPISTATLGDTTRGPYTPPRVCYRNGDLTITGNVQIAGMLAVNGDLIVRGTNNVITASKYPSSQIAFPALLVTGDLVLESGGSLEVNGLAVVDGGVLLSASAQGLSVVGGLFMRNTFAEAADDSAGNHPLLPYNGPVWRPSGGRTNGAAEFDGIDDRFEDPTGGSYLNGLSAMTISLWVKSHVVNQDRDIFYVGEPGDGGAALGLRYDKNGFYGGAVRNIKASIRATSGATVIESTSYVQTTSWQHLALVWQSGSSLRLYINGTRNMLSYDAGAAAGTTTEAQKFILGLGNKDKHWDGLIDDVRIYSRALDPNDIYPPSDGLPGLLAHWKLDETGAPAVPVTITAAPEKAAIVTWSGGPSPTRQHWGQATGAFFRSISRR